MYKNSKLRTLRLYIGSLFFYKWFYDWHFLYKIVVKIKKIILSSETLPSCWNTYDLTRSIFLFLSYSTYNMILAENNVKHTCCCRHTAMYTDKYLTHDSCISGLIKAVMQQPWNKNMSSRSTSPALDVRCDLLTDYYKRERFVVIDIKSNQ